MLVFIAEWWFFFFLDFIYFYFTHVSVSLHVYLFTIRLQFLQRPEEDIRFPDTEVTIGCERVLEIEPGSSGSPESTLNC